MSYTIRAASPPPAAFTRAIRTRDVRQIQIHATRGPTSEGRQVQATENWFASTALYPAGNRHVTASGFEWGGSADYVVGPDLRVNNEIVIAEFGDWRETWSQYSAGRGAHGDDIEAASIGVAIELAQRTSGAPFDLRTIDQAAWLSAEVILTVEDEVGFIIPTTRILSWDQRPDEPIPAGFIGHEDLANGKKLGKSDPGPMFPWVQFLAGVDGYLADNRPSNPSADTVRELLDEAQAKIAAARKLLGD